MKKVIIVWAINTKDFEDEIESALIDGYTRVGNMVVVVESHNETNFFQQMEMK